MWQKTLVKLIIKPAAAYVAATITNKYVLPAIERKVVNEVIPNAQAKIKTKIIPAMGKVKNSLIKKIMKR